MTINKKEEINIQLYQCDSDKNITSFLLIMDDDYNYIDSISSNDSILTLNKELDEGIYYIYTDIMYRYIDNIEANGYNITVTAINNEFELVQYEEDDIDYISIINSALISYISINAMTDSNITRI